MNDAPSANTRAILLLTAPLLIGSGSRSSVKPLATGEYNRLARRLQELRSRPSDLLCPGASALLEECRYEVDSERASRLLDRGFLLSQALERWSTRALWVTSRADAEYPQRLKKRLRLQAPPILYGCGNRADLDSGGLGVVGSRNVDNTLIGYTERVGHLAADAQCRLVSGGARGVDQAAMRGALANGGTAAGVLADSLERSAVRREYRDALMDGRLVLLCPFDPVAGFLVGHAMQRNKLIYALADAVLVVNAEFKKGGTWAGAVEQLDRHRFVPVYVRTTGEMSSGLSALQERGAYAWTDTDDPEALDSLLGAEPTAALTSDHSSLPTEAPGDRADASGHQAEDAKSTRATARDLGNGATLAGELLAIARSVLPRYLDQPRTQADVAEAFGIGKNQARLWLEQFVTDGVIERLSKPLRYRATGASPPTTFPTDTGTTSERSSQPAVELFARTKKLLLQYLDRPRTEADVADAFDLGKGQARKWLRHLVSDGAVDKRSKPVRYRAIRPESSTPLFPDSGIGEL